MPGGGEGMGGGNCKILERAPAGGEGYDSFSTQLGSWTCVCLGSSGRSALCFLFKLKKK